MKEIPAFLDYLRERDLSLATIDNYRHNLNIFARWFERETGQPATAATVTPLDLRQYRAWLKPQYKPATITRHFVALRGLFKWSVSTGAAATDPTGHLQLGGRIERRPKWLSRKEQYALLRLVQEQVQLAQVKGLAFSTEVAARRAAIVVVLLNTGLRVSELCNLKLGDVEIRERSGAVFVRSGKGDKSREIPLNLDARRSLQTWLKYRQADGDYLFVGREGQPLERKLVYWHIRELGKKAGLKLHPHKLRHTFAKNLVDAGVSLDRVAALLGHSDLDTTALYTQPSLTDLEQDVEKIQWSD